MLRRLRTIIGAQLRDNVPTRIQHNRYAVKGYKLLFTEPRASSFVPPLLNVAALRSTVLSHAKETPLIITADCEDDAFIRYLLSCSLEAARDVEIKPAVLPIESFIIGEYKTAQNLRNAFDLKLLAHNFLALITATHRNVFFVSPSTKCRYSNIFAKAFAESGFPVVSLMDENGLLLQSSADHASTYQVTERFYNPRALLDDPSASHAYSRELQFMCGLPQKQVTYFLVNSFPPLTSKTALSTNYFPQLVDLFIKDARETCNYIIFDNSDSPVITACQSHAIYNTSNIAIVPGHLRNAAWLMGILQSPHTIISHASLQPLLTTAETPRLLVDTLCAETSVRKLTFKGFRERLQYMDFLPWLRAAASDYHPSPHYSENYTRYLLSSANKRTISLANKTTDIKVMQGVQRYICNAFRANERSWGSCRNSDLHRIADSAAFFRWGTRTSPARERLQLNAKRVGGPFYYLEDSFIRSINIGLKDEPGLSFLLDDSYPYYEAHRSSRIESVLLSSWRLSQKQVELARLCISHILRYNISKYNHAPIRKVDLPGADCIKLLLLDQRYGDQSVPAGLATEYHFRKMVQDAIARPDKPLVILKRHPDATVGGASSYFTNSVLGDLLRHERVLLLDEEINPYCLFHEVDECWAVTSGMGFEALLAKKPVRTYGVSYYSNWGLTVDMMPARWRQTTRSVEEIFYQAYISHAVYCHPSSTQPVSLPEFLRSFSSGTE
jgi:hypothetical protein